MDDLITLFGSRENFRVEGQILGYREGDEGAYDPIRSNVLGEVGGPKIYGPITEILRHSDFQMSRGEFFIFWLMSQL